MAAASWTERRAGFSPWTWIALGTIVAISVYSDISRFEGPTGEKYLASFYRGGQADFSYPYTGARALVAGLNPYTTPLPEFHPPWHGAILVGNEFYYQIYPPTQVLLYVPLAWYYGLDVQSAGRFMFRFSLVCLVLLGVVVWRLVAAARVERVSALFVFPVAVALTFHPGMQLCLERGQSDVILALLCWASVLAMVRQRVALAWIMTVCATATKGYPLLFAFTLIPPSLRPKRWLFAGLGVLIGGLLFLLPVANYLIYGLKGTLWRTDMFWAVWYNHGFKLAAYWYYLDLEAAERARHWLAAFGAAVTALWMFRAWQRRHGSQLGSAALSLCGAATTALATVLGLSSLSIAYNICLILPGVIVLAASQERLTGAMGLGVWGRNLFGLAITLVAAPLFLYRWSDYFPLSALSLVVLVGFLGLCALAIGSRPHRRLLHLGKLW